LVSIQRPTPHRVRQFGQGWVGSKGFGVAWHAQVTPNNVQKATLLNDQNDTQKGGKHAYSGRLGKDRSLGESQHSNASPKYTVIVDTYY
jgi:hypothetical protein